MYDMCIIDVRHILPSPAPTESGRLWGLERWARYHRQGVSWPAVAAAAVSQQQPRFNQRRGQQHHMLACTLHKLARRISNTRGGRKLGFGAWEVKWSFFSSFFIVWTAITEQGWIRLQCDSYEMRRESNRGRQKRFGIYAAAQLHAWR